MDTVKQNKTKQTNKDDNKLKNQSNKAPMTYCLSLCSSFNPSCMRRRRANEE
jgi:hypothetical protein